MKSLSLRFARTILKVSIAFIALLPAAPSHANSPTIITFTSGSYQASGLANDGTQNTDFDRVYFSSESGTLTLTVNTPVTQAINNATFTVGPSSLVEYGPISYVGSETFTVNGTTETLKFPYTVSSLYVTDQLHILPGNTTSFALGKLILDVTPQEQLIKTANNTTSPFNATFELRNPANPNGIAAVPEPSSTATFAIGGLIMACSLLIVRRRRAI